MGIWFLTVRPLHCYHHHHHGNNGHHAIVMIAKIIKIIMVIMIISSTIIKQYLTVLLRGSLGEIGH